jgi:hypothetical protein
MITSLFDPKSYWQTFLVECSPRQLVFRFPNGYGASVINDGYGKANESFELAVIKFTGNDFKLVYDTPVTGDVLGWLKVPELFAKLSEIEALPPLTNTVIDGIIIEHSERNLPND